jgi:Na+-translocating ferredoxin:NAD+ oxidoreductase RnfC subunit
MAYLLSLYLSVKRSHHVHREGLEITTLIQKREEYTPLDFTKISRSRLIQKIHKFGIKIRKSKESIFNTNTINKYINSELKIRKIVVNVYTD